MRIFTDFLNSFTDRFPRRLLHLNYVATLPSEMRNSQ